MSEPIKEMPQGPDPRLAVIAQMVAVIFTEMLIYHDSKVARRRAIDESFLLYGEIAIRLAENDR